jgi:beta-galactosidase
LNYSLTVKGAILNWFDITTPEKRFSLNDTIADIMTTFRGKLWFISATRKISKQMRANKKNQEPAGFTVNLKGNRDIMKMIGGFTVIRLANMLGMINVSLTKEELLKMNQKLNRIKKPSKKH